MAETKPSLPIPKVLKDRYEMREFIGKGGMAVVYTAYDEILHRQVAIKILNEQYSDDDMSLARFLREARLARAIDHPNVIGIFDVIIGSDFYNYFVMEYLSGPTLKEFISTHYPIPAEQAVGIMKTLTSAVIAIHEEGIIHRDIKPQNVLLDTKGSGSLKIIDFGIAIEVKEVIPQRTQGNQAVMGSSHYLAPETAIGFPPDFRVDIYALGIVFFELLSGSVPFNGPTPTEIALKHMKDPLPGLQAYNPTVTQGIENVVIKATAKSPDERYQSAQELMDALEQCLAPEMRYVEPLKLKVTSLDFPSQKEQEKEEEMVQEDLQSVSHIQDPQEDHWPFFWLGLGIFLLSCILLLTLSVSLGWTPINGWFGWHQVPAVTGLSKEKAIETLVEAGIDPESIIIEPVASDLVDLGLADSTDVQAGQFIKDEPITLKVSKGPTFLVGDYIGQSLVNVEKIFHDNNLNIIIDSKEVGDADHVPGTILSQEGLPPGSRIDPSALQTIHFTISAYPTLLIDDSYLGMNIDEAKELLNAKGIAVLTRNIYGTDEVIDIDPPIGTWYTQEGSDSVLTLYH